jgi:transcriptional regulator with XRE-family HTH domain
MRDFGEQRRRMRVLAGLSQEELARMAGVSQGSVSRLESGRGLATPMQVVSRINQVLARALLAWGPLLNERLRGVFDLERTLYPPPPRGAASPPPMGADVEELLRLYEALPDRQRSALVAVLTAAAEALAGGGSEPRAKRRTARRRKRGRRARAAGSSR